MCEVTRVYGASRIVITGASRGIGRATALALARRGEHLVLAARNAESLQAVAAEASSLGAGSAQVVVLDVTSDSSVEAGCREILAAGPVDVLINNAGDCEQRPFLQRTAASCEREMSVNYFGAQRMVRGLLPSMISRRSGLILNVSSFIGAIACPTTANYSAAKAALNMWSHALRGEIAAHGVRVSVFMPSHTETELGSATRYDGVYVLPLEYTVKELLHALDHAPRSYAASPIFRMILRVAAVFPGWAERQVAKSTAALLT